MKKTFLRCAALFFLAAMSASAQFTGITGGGQAFDNRQPTMAIRYIICTNGVYPTRDDFGIDTVDRSQGLLGEIRAVAFNASLPPGWGNCDGQLIPIAQNTGLFSLLGAMYGGNGFISYALPNLGGRVPIGAGQGPGLAMYELAANYGEEQSYLTINNLPSHFHSTINGNTGSTGGNTPFNNIQPSLALNFMITETGEVELYPGNFAPHGWAFCDGSLMDIEAYPTLYSNIGTTYGGDGVTTFGFPTCGGARH